MLDFYLKSSSKSSDISDEDIQLSLGGAVYWHLHRYFMHADLNPGSFSFLNLYEDTDVTGYQLVRLIEEMKRAKQELSSYGDEVAILVGWNGDTKSKESEDWRKLDKRTIEATVDSVIELLERAYANGDIVEAVGD